ncbi:unnamed protein product [Citrullus colocynthis]|uniref:Uncharacterized protein n=1 Tax=Citrullus colocynthis TaxID=252529 RepID=A0ABP0Z7E0_9ROSI
MPFSSFSLNPFPDRKKPTPTEPAAEDDELAAVKAAAWAWYQHGSGSESKPIREFGLTRPIPVPKPSRYRLEATRSSSLLIQDNTQSPNPHNSLLDSYEIASISKRLSDLLDPTDPQQIYSLMAVAEAETLADVRQNGGCGSWHSRPLAPKATPPPHATAGLKPALRTSERERRGCGSSIVVAQGKLIGIRRSGYTHLILYLITLLYNMRPIFS